MDRMACIEVCEGYPAKTILKQVEKYQCDLTVMGTREKGMIHTLSGERNQECVAALSYTRPGGASALRLAVFTILAPICESSCGGVTLLYRAARVPRNRE